MKRTIFLSLSVVFVIALAGCQLPKAPTPTPTQVEASATPVVAASATPTVELPTSTDTAQPEATATPSVAATAVSLSQVVMLDAQQGWGVGKLETVPGAAILRTADGALTWQVATPPDAQPSADSQAVGWFPDAQHAWVAFGQPGMPEESSAAIWRTSDGGQTWESTSIDTSSLTMEFFYIGQISFSDAQHGWALAHLGVGMSHDYVAVLTTADGGASWQYVVDPGQGNVPMSCYKDSLWFPDSQHGFLVGTCGGVISGLYLYATSDGGHTWNELTLPAPAEMPDAFTNQTTICEGRDMHFDGQVGRVLVRCYNQDGVDERWRFITQDGGTIWTPALLPGPWGEWAALSPTRAWYFAQPSADETAGTKVFQTVDGGATWQQISTVNWSGAGNFVDAQQGWIVARTGEESALVHSQDGGVVWEILQPVAQ